MRAIGIDTHKASLACCVVDEVGRPVDERSFGNDARGHEALRRWAADQGDALRIGVEGSSTYGAAGARFLIKAGFDVREVPPHLSRRERLRIRRPGKSDPGDALAIARVALREATLPPVRVLDVTTELGLLLAAREDLVVHATQVRNRLHADLVVLAPGYGARIPNLRAARNLTAVARLLRGRHDVHAELARARLASLRRLAVETVALERELARRVAGHPMLRLHGARALTVARLVAESGDLRRFRSDDAFAALAGVAPIPASSGQRQHMRLNRGGNRQLNRAFHVIATTQARYHPAAREYVARKRAEGKSIRDALRCLKRQLVRTVFRLLLEGQLRWQMAA